jgi:hypothetical protein
LFHKIINKKLTETIQHDYLNKWTDQEVAAVIPMRVRDQLIAHRQARQAKGKSRISTCPAIAHRQTRWQSRDSSGSCEYTGTTPRSLAAERDYESAKRNLLEFMIGIDA